MSDNDKPIDPPAAAPDAAPDPATAVHLHRRKTDDIDGDGDVDLSDRAQKILREAEEDFKAHAYSVWKMSKTEWARLLFTLGLIAALFAPDWSALRTMSYVMGVFLGVAFISHIVRKYVLFPYLDMKTLYHKARKEPLPAAIVFASVCGIIMVCIDTAAKFFTRG